MLRYTILTMIAVLALAFAWANVPLAPLPLETKSDRVVVIKSKRVLELYQGARLLKTYEVSLGRGPVGPKEQEGDKRTPEGIYQIDFRNEGSAFHLSLHISYPNRRDLAAAQKRNVSPGGDIMVHGMRNGLGWIGKMHRFVDWTAGCIAVTNAEIEEIWRAVPDGTPIEIRA